MYDRTASQTSVVDNSMCDLLTKDAGQDEAMRFNI